LRLVFGECWLAFFRIPLPMDIYKSILNKVHSHVIPYIDNPLLLVDFLTHSYSAGGVISILSLHGIFILITQYNLDYPDFFKKLYALLDPSIFLAKYRKKFFKLFYTFLISASHLPAYLVAAFIKKFARLLLVAPPFGCSLMITIIWNLLKKHPSCRNLIHHSQKQAVSREVLLIGWNPENQENERKPLCEMEGFDPYIFSEEDPAKCNAIHSSLWELEVMSQHYCPSVSRLVKIFEGDFDKKEHDVLSIIEQSFESLFYVEIKKKSKGVTPLVVKTQSTLFGENEFQLWSF